jgi:hypothetical protein
MDVHQEKEDIYQQNSQFRKPRNSSVQRYACCPDLA